MNSYAKLDLAHVWHPFTQMLDWQRTEPIVISAGNGATLVDTRGRKYLDANSSIWTNLHGHRHPAMDRAIQSQLRRISHASFLGLANEPASLLAGKLVQLAGAPIRRVFYSDDGSTAMEAALKLAYEFSRRTGQSKRPRFLGLTGAYHGDTVGAVSLGHIDLSHKAYAGLLFKSDAVMSPYCYRCPFNKAKPERVDARLTRKCNWECVGKVEQQFDRAAKVRRPYSAFVVEPLIQGAAGMIPQPVGWLRKVSRIVRHHGALLIADEVMTAFGRASEPANKLLLASHQEGAKPDLIALAKGLTGGYLPMAATLATDKIFKVFLGDYSEFKTFFHGHSYTGNPLGAAAALASLKLLQSPATHKNRVALASAMDDGLQQLWKLPAVGDIRRVGLIAGIELVRDWKSRKPFDLREQVGIRVCQNMAKLGVLTRPIGNVIVLMPPYCTTKSELDRMMDTLARSIRGLR